MDFKDLWGNIKEKCSLIYGKIKDFVLENKMISACIAALVLVIIIAFILLVSALKKTEKPVYERPLTLSEEMLVPPSPAIPDGYNTSRTTKENWTNEEAESWFTKPGDKEINDLSRANDRIISDIIGAAP